MSSTPDDKPQRATAAQLANRKIKEVRRRRPNSAAPSAPAPSFGGVSSTPASSQTASNGFTFGQSQNQTPSQNGGTPFAFGSGGGGSSSSSFNFSSSFGGTSSASNPFASMNTTTSDQSSKPASFSGFQGSLFNIPPGGNHTGGLFGASTNNGPSASGSIFGQNNAAAAASTPSTNLFGQSSVKKPSPFDDSMQTSPDAKGSGSAPPAQPSFAGAGSTSLFETPSKPVFDFKATTPSTSLFGGAATPTPSASTPAPAAPSTPFQNPFQSSNLFQTTPSTSQKPDEEKKEEPKPADSQPKSPFQFSASTTTPGSLFAKSDAPASPAPAAPSTDAEQTKAPANPFGGFKPAGEQQPLPSSSTPFQGLFSKPSTSNDAAKTSEPEKQATPGPMSFAPSSGASPAPAAETQATAASTSAAPVDSPIKVNGANSSPSMQTPKLAGKTTDPKTSEDAEMLYRMRTLNDQNFDAAVQFYMRVRATLGASVGEAEDAVATKKARPFGIPSEKADTPKENSTTPAGFGTSQASPASSKRNPAKPNIFAQSFSKSKTEAEKPEPSVGSASTSLFSSSMSRNAPKNPFARSFEDAEKEKEKRKAEDFDSEEEDEAEWERQQFGTQTQKRAKFVPDESNESPAKKAEDSSSTTPGAGTIFSSQNNTAVKSNNIFDNDNDADDTEEASTPGDESDDAAENAEPEAGGRSLFDRRQGEEEPKGNVSTLFGSSNFSSGDTTSSIFGTPLSAQNATKSTGDNTWKPDSPINASSSKPDSGSATPALEAPKPFSNLFGAPPSLTKSSTSKDAQPSLGFTFGTPGQSSPSVFAPSTLTSAAPSRSTTPGGASDTGAEESGDGDGAESLPQLDLTRGGAGEENEDLVAESRARAMKHTTGTGWESQGVGFLRVLKDRTTSRGRIVVRADPSGKVILNTRLMKEIRYSVAKNSVQFLVPQSEGPPQMWALRVKTNADAERLCKSMEETKN
ncbi:RanBP1 domain protein [Aspergillus niger CBS 101883]|uniref:RanBP1 domain protein n=1 Tax=Aspergillus lacticoffeatus (strain CBS 101883) TaxID=1450533 RepID=UPI000D7ED7DF|nr:uncharacterized protein BO96DRAFT_435966 [Aspergillus niger CBS 101883]PYH54772.1 hypothetical protein BO96DRAFT_435966 [Aspergillus niger CBS 101883]